MKFSIVWIDDAKGWVNSLLEEVESIFKEKEFSPVIKKFEETTAAKDIVLDTYVDLILVDYHLAGQKGDEFIKEIRQKRCFAQVVFYSQDVNNSKLIKPDNHFIHVTSKGDISSKLKDLADQAYRTYNDPAFMRGLLLSEFIDLENLMEELISRSFKEQKEFFRKAIIHKMGESFTLSVKKNFILWLIKEAKKNEESSLGAELGTIEFTANQFDEYINKRRNILAHAHLEYDVETGEIKLISAIGDVDFNPSWFHETREKIHEHKKKIRRLIAMELQKVVKP